MKYTALSLIAFCLAVGISSRAETSTESVALDLGAAVEKEIAGGQTHTYQIKLDRDQFAALRLEQRGIDVAVELMSKDGEVIAQFDDEVRPEGAEEIAVVAEAPGLATLVVRTVLKNAPPGRYELRFLEVRAANEDERTLHGARKLRAQSARLHAVGKDNEALLPIENARGLAEKVFGPDHALVAQLIKERGEILLSLSNYAEAKSSFARAVAGLEKTLGPEHLHTASSMQWLGNVCVTLGAQPEADQFLRRALAIEEKALGKDHPRVAQTLQGLGRLNVNRGDSKTGEAQYLRAFAILDQAQETESALYAALSSDLAHPHHQRQDYAGAERLLQRALAIYEKLYGPDHLQVAGVLQNMGITATANKEFGKAEQVYRRALALRENAHGPEHFNVAFILNNLANLSRVQDQHEKSLELSQRALRILEKTAGPYQSVTLFALGSIARTYALVGDLPNAIKFQKRAETFVERSLDLNLATGSERQKLAYLKTIQLRTDRAISLNLQLAPTDPEASALAALIVLQRKGRVLDAMTDTLSVLRERADPQDRALLDQLNETRTQLARLALGGPQKAPTADDQAAIAELEEKKEKLEAEISQRSAQFRSQTQTVTLDAVQTLIPETAALLEFVVYRPFDPKIQSDRESLGEARYGVFVVRREGPPQGLDLGAAKELEAAVEAFRQALRDPQRGDVRELARALDETIMQPIRAHLGEETQLLLSPDGELNLLPFESLVDEKGDHLVKRYAFTYLTSGRDLLRLKVARESRSKDLVIADPRFGASPRLAATSARGNDRPRSSVTAASNLSETYFAPLPGTLREARSIQALFPDALFLSGAAATEAALKKVEAPRLLHIATHGFFLAESPAAEKEATANPLLRSGLALANANAHGQNAPTDDGILTALEASGLNLWGTKLVVLSACDTGLGEVKNGEGVYGLRRAFVLGGAESVVMSLWPISDDSTRRLMAGYYKNLKAGLGRGESLRRVQLDLLARDPKLHPFYWANFIQSGAWAGLDGER